MRYQLSLDQIPSAWFNVLPVMPEPLQPPLHPATNEPIGPDDLAPLFPMGLIAQEVSTEPWIDVPGEVLDILRLWRPTPLIRADRLERALGTSARIYFKDESVSPAGSHKPNTAVPQAFYNKTEGVTRLSTETGAGQWGTALAFACAEFDLDCKVYMVRASYEQKPYRKILMETWGARGRTVTRRRARPSRFTGTRDQRRRARRGQPRGHALLARLRPQPCPVAPDGDRARSERATRARGRGKSRCRDRAVAVEDPTSLASRCRSYPMPMCGSSQWSRRRAPPSPRGASSTTSATPRA